MQRLLSFAIIEAGTIVKKTKLTFSRGYLTTKIDIKIVYIPNTHVSNFDCNRIKCIDEFAPKELFIDKTKK